jgi:hypothetical protein
MDYETALNTCSDEVRAAIKWLEANVKFDRSKWEAELENIERFWEEEKREEFLRRLKVEYLCGDALWFYVLSKVNSPLVTDFLEAAKSGEFWRDEKMPEGFDGNLFEEPFLLWYLLKLELNENEYFKNALEVYIKKPQTREGKISTGDDMDLNHPRALRVLVTAEPDSDATTLAVRYFLGNLDEFKSDLRAIAIGVLALCELDYFKFKETIEDLGNFLKSEQKDAGYWGEIRHWKKGTISLPIVETSVITEALSKVFGQKDESVIKAVEWLKKHRKEDGRWGSVDDTAYACLALMSVGEGPKVPLDEIEWNERLTKQALERIKPTFVQTSPNLGVTEIKKQIQRMLNNANERIWICSRFITEFWTDIITLKREKPHLDVRIVTHPITGQNRARYEGDGKKFVVPAFDALQRLLEKNFKTQPLLHARLYIIDNEALISSADITAEQLEKEFNAGIWTRDKATVEAAVKFFENIWNESGDEAS